MGITDITGYDGDKVEDQSLAIPRPQEAKAMATTTSTPTTTTTSALPSPARLRKGNDHNHNNDNHGNDKDKTLPCDVRLLYSEGRWNREVMEMRWYKETIVSWVMLLFPLLVLGCPESLPENTEFKCPCTDGWTCMDNVCRKYCESYSHCPEGQYCHEQGHCLPWEEVDPDCQPKCEGMECGNDGCGGSCGQCLEGDTCVSGQCQEGECIPDCGGNECGEDGCGSSCGICTNGSICSVDGLCVESPLQPVVLIATHPGWKEATCLDCHMADGHNEGLNPYLCVDCHGANGAPAGHSNSEACNGCHGDKHSPQGFPDPVSCVTCHPTR